MINKKLNSKKTILILENDSELASELAELFGDKFLVISATTGNDALKKLELDRYVQKIYLIIVDLDYPNDEGFDFIEDVKMDAVMAEIPIIAISSDISSETEIAALKLGAVDCLAKPFNYLSLFHKGINAVQNRESANVRLESILNKEQGYIAAELELRANIDTLTGIYNKFSFIESTKKMLKCNLDKDFTLIRLNVERFKVINDIFGLKIGDMVLMNIATAFKRIFGRPQDDVVKSLSESENALSATFGRFVADNFVACFETAKFNVDDIIGEVEKEIDIHALNYAVQIKVGIFEVDDKFLDIEQMCDRANLALQSIKGNYLKKTAYYDNTLRDVLLQEQELIREMQDALKNHEFEIYLQPIVNIYAERIDSAEALVRWNHPRRGLLAPGGFVPFFEKCGLIATLDYYVWDCAFAYQKNRMDRGLKEISVSVNISRMSLYNPHLCDDIVALAKKYDVPPRLVKLEITESAYNDNPGQLLNTMSVLQQNGFIILMDDFGSGYSSLNMLKDVPVDILKIDMCFLQDFGKSPRSTNILASIIRMAKWLKVPVVCEGVENQNQLDFLKEMGCEFVQGFYYSKPVPIKKFEELEENGLNASHPMNSLVNEIAEFNVIFDGNEFVSRLFNTFVGAVAFYEFLGDRLEVVRVNDNYYNVMNYTPLTFHSNKTNVFEMVVPEDRNILLNACKDATEGKMPGEIQIRRYLPDGTIIWLSVVVRLIGGNERHSIVCCAMNNITEYKINETKIKEQSITINQCVDLFKNVINNMPYGICQYTTDDEPTLIFANRASFEMFEEKFSEGFFMSKIQVKIADRANTKELKQRLERVKKTGVTEKYSANIILQSGKKLSIMGQVCLLKSYDDKMVFQDIFYQA